MSQSQRILIDLIAGVAVGAFFGERAAILDWPARAFVQFHGVTVLPYLVTSIISGIARGTGNRDAGSCRVPGVYCCCCGRRASRSCL